MESSIDPLSRVKNSPLQFFEELRLIECSCGMKSSVSVSPPDVYVKFKCNNCGKEHIA